MGSGRDSRTFQVGNHILVLRQALGFSFSGARGGGKLVVVGGGGGMEKNAVSEI